MKIKLLAFLLVAVSASQLPAQQIINLQSNAPAVVAPPHTNTAIIPVSREGKAVEGQTLVLNRAKDNQGPCDIAFIGDSITQGQGGHGPSYRYHLWNRLMTAGYLVDFVGSSNQPFAAWNLGMLAQPFQPDGASVTPLPFDDFDPDHEGHAERLGHDLRIDRVDDRTLSVACPPERKMALLRTLGELGREIDDVDLLPPTLDELYAHFLAHGSAA